VSLDEITNPTDPGDTHAPTGPRYAEPAHIDTETEDDVTAIDAALTRLGELDERQAKIVEMRYFGGLTIEETAQVLNISDATVKREWTLARAWLRRELSKGA
jgi:RNA polymerase sigma factor (sigma-70 family)